MKKIFSKAFTLMTILVIAFCIAGCTAETAPRETSIPSLNAISGNHLDATHDFEGEGFQILTSYNTGRYDFSNWRITDSKFIDISAVAANVPEGTTILIEHVHVDMSIKSTAPQLDSMLQDSMDDSYHGSSQDGFYIDSKYKYNTKFAVEGFSSSLINGWDFATSSASSDGTIYNKKLTEKSLISDGKVYANKMTVIFDILVKNKGEDYFHTLSFVDEFLIPLKDQIEPADYQ